MLPFLIPAIVAGIAGITATALNNASNESINAQQIAHSENMNEQQLALSHEALDAQKQQQAWANEQYLENRDYSRALQQTIFNREDTAVSRVLDDARNAGLSPLSVLGMSAGAGQVVSSPSAPSSMVSNNQASLSHPNLRANDYGSLAQSGSQIAQMLATSFENRKAQDNQAFITQMQLAEQAKEAGLGRLHDKMMKQLDQDFMKNQDNVKHYRELMYKLSDQDFQIKLQGIIASDNRNLESQRQQGAADLQTSQQTWQSSENELTRAGEKSRGEYLNQIINALSEGDGKMSKWLRENSDLLIPVLQYVDSIIAQ